MHAPLIGSKHLTYSAIYFAAPVAQRPPQKYLSF
ncbi:protein of unknown function [Bradyrhizobium vignae]|uniref:Uncharacterized protein n=1 Tax=Bradyrhizobium vignae TaxID=1549949 RepID=A0A2U3PVA0_9BRAD|nr:protein of unknown function [Bradyrhizobium vignae]